MDVLALVTEFREAIDAYLSEQPRSAEFRDGFMAAAGMYCTILLALKAGLLPSEARPIVEGIFGVEIH